MTSAVTTLRRLLPRCAAMSLAFACAAEAAEPLSASAGSLFAPSQVPSLGKLVLGAGSTISFDTGSLGRAAVPPKDEKDKGITAIPAREARVSGAVTGSATLGRSASGQVEVAIYSFDEITLSKGAVVEVTGDRGLVLLSKGAVVIDTTISISGTAGGTWTRGTNDGSGQGGPGADGGAYGKTTASAPPPYNGGDGGPAMKDNGRPGFGMGAGYNQRVKGGAGGGGGAYGGAGGETSVGSAGGGFKEPTALAGGKPYGDAALTDLFGGSGGAGASNDRAFTSAGGGGGGGSVAIISATSISISGTIEANGGAGGADRGCGGGGSGGGILLAAPTVTFTPGAAIAVNGGAGGDGGPGVLEDQKPKEDGTVRGRRQSVSGGGGGGGRIAIYSKEDFGATGENKEETKLPDGGGVNGGKGGTAAKDGSAGTFYDGAWPGLK